MLGAVVLSRLGVGLALAGLIGAAATGCSVSVNGGDAPAVSKTDLEKDISARLVQKTGHRPQTVTCKSDLPGQVGKTTRCEVMLSSTNSFEPVVTVTKVEGSTVSYDMTPAVNKEQLEKSVANLVSQASGATVDSVSCAGGLDGEQGAETHCEVTAGGVTLNRTVEVTKVDGLMMNFTVIPVLPKQQAESSLLDQLAAQLNRRPDSADCAGDLEGKTGNTLDCTVVAGDEKQVFTLTVTTVDGNRINYNYAPKA
ncbi:DUF4333 domain-containing protein [Mycolicibacterium sp. CBM1]